MFGLTLIFFLIPQFGLAETIKIRVIHEKADVFLKADLKSAILKTVKAGTMLDAEEKRGEWFRVVLPPDERGFSVTGYVHSSLVEVETPTEQVEPETPPLPPLKEALKSEPPLLPRAGAAKMGPMFGFRISGGLSFPRVGDLNRVLGKEIESYYFPSGTSVDGEIVKIQKAVDIDAEILIHITPHFGLTLGSGYISARNPKNKSSFTATYSGSSVVIKDEMIMSSVPLRLGLFYSFPITSFFRIYLTSGLGFYFARCSEYESYEIPAYNNYIIEKWEASGSGLGFHGGLGFEIDVTRNFGFVLEANGRYARIDGLSGTYDHDARGIMKMYINGLDPQEEGDLYYFEYIAFTPELLPELMIRNSKPGNPYVTVENVRLAIVDFSGFSLKFGMKFSF